MNNEYDYLREQALKRAKQGRSLILDAERNFHNALYHVRNHLPPGLYRDLEKHWIALGEYPAALRAVMDAEYDAREFLSHAMHIRKMEKLANEGIEEDLEKVDK